jgi:hypothetical protein
VVGVAQQGKQGFLRGRAEEIAALLNRGIAVCLPDLRGTGETSPGSDRGRNSEATAISSSELMLGNTLVGLRLKDLRSVLRWLRTTPEIDPHRIAVWGDSMAAAGGTGILPVLPTSTGETPVPPGRIEVPLGISDEPNLAEPLGPLVAILAGLFEDDVAAVVARGGLAGFRSVVGALAPRPLWVQRCIDGTNRAVPAASVREEWGVAAVAYQAAGARENLVIAESDRPLAEWLVSRLVSAPPR